MYKLSGSDSVIRLIDGACIPFDDGNIEYQEYCAWLELGNTPEPQFSEAELAAMQLAKDAETENLWRATELVVISRQLEAIEEGEADESPPDLLPGTKKQWLKYRGQVSNWKDGADFFPALSHRPVRPV
ncbi:hypothetical protein KVG88_06290 [Pseudomonas sp. SWRI74]|uniref:Phage tail protein n=1 Tax=Pseudomonas azerbaijanoccidentalis TaxID=2842347 RepID=A0ABS6QMJ2_9PSED|nr:hypothetical protein [Pseudomonas azerbaijanoccidentalis]MBV4519666.1 hypothetical protein [Pseudomonas azerbaijanoccidentalis]